MSERPSVGIVGGGLAGLAAAAILCERGFHVELFEAKRFLGGRAGSFVDPASGELVDHCQHVAMGCCTNFLDFCRRTGIAHLFRKDGVLHFFAPDGRRCDVSAARWLPAPLHLAPSLLRLSYLTWRDKWRIAQTLRALASVGHVSRPDVEQVSRPAREEPASTDKSADLSHVGPWLREQGQSQQAIDRFWSVVLVSALGEDVERASLAAARKVFVDGFLAHRSAYHVYVPQAPLGAIYEEGVAGWLRARGVEIHLESRIDRVAVESGRLVHLVLGDRHQTFDETIVAAPWHVLPRLFDASALRQMHLAVDSFTGSPITSIHLWFDRPIMDLPHAVLVARLTQWVFRHEVEQVSRPARQANATLQPNGGAVVGRPSKAVHATGSRTRRPWKAVLQEGVESRTLGDLSHIFHYQTVISASGDLQRRSKESILAEVLADLRATFPGAAAAGLLRHRILTQPSAVFSYRPGLDAIRPPQQTPIENLFLAGDWTATGWPSTMESAVRSGYLAAAAILSKHGREPADVLAADLQRGPLARLLLPK